MKRPGCAAIARTFGEAARGTAPENCDAWVLVEHPGPWPSFDVPPGIPAEVAELIDTLPAYRIRPQLIRRAGARRPVPPHTVFICFSGSYETEPWTERREITDLRDLLDVDWERVGRGIRPHWGVPHHEPLLLVCTHGKRERCCAEFGRPTVKKLTALYGDPVWETTHVGGDRFAANLVTLPWGTYHGKVTEDVAETVGAACLRGEVELEHYRGLAGLPYAVQAAAWFAHRAADVAEIVSVRPLSHVMLPDGRTCVDVEAGGRVFQITVDVARSGCPRLTSCSESAVTDPGEYVLDSILDLTAADAA